MTKRKPKGSRRGYYVLSISLAVCEACGIEHLPSLFGLVAGNSHRHQNDIYEALCFLEEKPS